MSSIASLIFYLSAFGLSAYLFSFATRSKKRYFYGLSLAIPLLIGGFRYGVGTDYFNYINIFNSHLQNAFNINDSTEIGYVLLEQFASLFDNSTRVLFIITTFLSLIFFYAALVRFKSHHPGLVVFLYLTTLFPMSLNAVRQGIAVSIVTLALSYAKDRRFIPFLLWTLFAGLFHISALLVIPFYFIMSIGSLRTPRQATVQKTRSYSIQVQYVTKLILMTVITTVITINALALTTSIPIFDKYELYSHFNEDGGNAIFYIKLMLVLSIFILSKQIILKSDAVLNSFLMAGAIVEVILLLLGFSSPFIKRQALYFAPLFMLLIATLPALSKNKLKQSIIYIIVAMYGMAFFIVSYYILDQADIIPYAFSISGGQ